MRLTKLFIILIVFLSLFAVNSVTAAELVVNGGFESNDFTGWTRVNDGDGNFFVYSGTMPDFGFGTILLSAPPEGTYAAVSAQDGPGFHILYQDVAIPSGVTPVVFSATVYVENHASDYAFGTGFNFEGGPNQQVRVDIMDPGAPVDDIGAGVLQNLFLTSPGDPLSIGYTNLSADLSVYSGQTIRVRIAEVDNQDPLFGAIDAVSIDDNAAAPVAIPTLSEWGMIIFSVLLAVAAVLVIRRRTTV